MSALWGLCEKTVAGALVDGRKHRRKEIGRKKRSHLTISSLFSFNYPMAK